MNCITEYRNNFIQFYVVHNEMSFKIRLFAVLVEIVKDKEVEILLNVFIRTRRRFQRRIPFNASDEDLFG